MSRRFFFVCLFAGQLFSRPIVIVLTLFLMVLMLTELPKVPLGVIALCVVFAMTWRAKKIKQLRKK